MKRIILLIALSAVLASCAQTRSGVSSGLLVTSWDDTVSGSVNNSVALDKRGEACVINVLGIVAVGDSSVEAAKKAGSINKVAVADTNYLNVLGIFQKGCTVAKGE
ncbi:MAG: TRL-like family protein [Rickettsiales bacterium]|nr:TRL-like family protein [Rickettsiales bacterium]